MTTKIAYNYKDILLQPKYSILDSRSQADTSMLFGSINFKLPVVPANMKTVIGEDLAVWLAQNNYFYVMHRFGIDTIEFCKYMKLEKNLYVSISVGVNDDSYDMLNKLKETGINIEYITVDIAHGQCNKMKNMINYLNDNFSTSFIIAGNVCTPSGVEELEKWGADSVKVGIGPGSVCTTKLKTGFSYPQFSAVLECCKVAKKPIIADGGIEHNGDIAKALAAGASMVMAGGIFAGHSESPGKTIIQIENDYEIHYKEFYGSASEHSKGEKKNVEGRRILIPLKGSIVNTYQEITQDIQSSISYAGGNDLSALNQVNWVIVH